MAEVTLGLDLGTSGVRVVAVDENGSLRHEVTRSYPLHTPKPGWTEQDPADWVQESVAALQDIVNTLQRDGLSVAALGLSGQMHGMVPLDNSGEVVRPAILWNDQRTADAVQTMSERVPRETMIARTGNPAITGFHVCKLVWLRNHEPGAFKRTLHSLLPKDYLAYVLTGNMHAEPSDASGTNCFQLETKRWDAEILQALDLSPTLFPEIISSHEVAGKVTRRVAEQTGLPEGLPVVIGAGDNAAAAIGLGISSRQPEVGSVSLGTSGVIFSPLSAPSPDPEGRVHLFCHADGGYHLLGVTLSAAGSFQWYRDTFAPQQSFNELTELAATSPVGSRGVIFKPYLAGERTPHLNAALRGSLTGLSLASTQADVVRAVLEGVAFSLRDALDIIQPIAPLTHALATGGGAKSTLWLQMTTDVLGLPLHLPERNQGAAYGAALLAYQGIGATDSAASLASQSIKTRYKPSGADYGAVLARYREVPLLN
jgi:xylulokinase